MKPPRPGSTRSRVYEALRAIGRAASAAEVVRKIGPGVDRAGIDVALTKGAVVGDITRSGEPRAYRYTLNATAPSAVATGPAACAAAASPSDAAAPPQPFASSLGTRCSVPPENRSQGTIAQALRAVMSADAPLALDEIFLALPVGWSRAEALAGLNEAVHARWATCSRDGWLLIDEPPEAAAADPLAVVNIPHHAQLRLQEIGAGVHELLRDAVLLRQDPRLIRALATTNEEIHAALALLAT